MRVEKMTQDEEVFNPTIRLKQPFFSIVMPSYNVEKYISRAVTSIENQTFADYELIIVNDGSTDHTLSVAEELKKTDSRIKIVDLRQNGGLAHARNVGTDCARGRYIWYMDADDYVESYLLERVYNSLQRYPVQLLMFGMYEEYLDKVGRCIRTNINKPERRFYGNRKEIHQSVIEYEQNLLIGYAWNKVFDLEYLREKKLYFLDIPLVEDVLFAYDFLRDIDTMTVLDMVPYHYEKKVENNLTNAFVPSYFKVHRIRILSLYRLHEEWGAITPEFESKLGSLYTRYILSAVERSFDQRAHISFRGRVLWVKRLYKDWLFQRLVKRAIPKESRTLLFAINIMKTENALFLTLAAFGVHLIRKFTPWVYIVFKEGR